MRIQSLYRYSDNLYTHKTNFVAFKSGVSPNHEQVSQIVSRDGADAIKAATLPNKVDERFKLQEEAIRHLEEYQQLKAVAAEQYQKDCKAASDIIELVQKEITNKNKNKFRDVIDSKGNPVRCFKLVGYKGNILPRLMVEKNIPGVDKRISYFDKGKLERFEEYVGNKKNIVYVKGKLPLIRKEGFVVTANNLITAEREIRYSRPYRYPAETVNFDYYIGVQDFKSRNRKVAKSYVSDGYGRLSIYQEGFFDDMDNEYVKIDREFEYDGGVPKSYSEEQFKDWGYKTTKKKVDFDQSYVQADNGVNIPVVAFVE